MKEVSLISDFDLGNGASTTLTFDQYGFLDTIRTVKGTTDIQNWDYDFNTTFGNMTKRKGLKPNGAYIEETFAYDSQDRLLARYRGATGTSLTYDTGGEGNITSKSDVGTYNYNSTYPHQVEEITNPTSLMQDLPTQNITYTKFNKTSTVSVTDTGLDKDLTITYGPDQLRVKTVLEDNSSTVLTKYYALGMYEKEVHATEGTRELYYINTPSGISAILESTSSYDSIFYIHTDILGSYDVITDDQGGIRERLSFDPWGRRRNTSSWDYTGVPASFKFDRGFTGHEHLDDFSLINMNGRMYDPILAMFLSPDPFIRSPCETQNFNRYAYVLNNPLKYTDPSGYVPTPYTDGDGNLIYYYDDETGELIWASEIIGRESYYFGPGWSSVTTSPQYRQGGAYEWVSEVKQVGEEYTVAIFPDGKVKWIRSPELATVMSKNFYQIESDREANFGLRVKYGLNIGYHSPFGSFYIENGLTLWETKVDRLTLDKIEMKNLDLKLFKIGWSIPLLNVGLNATLDSNLKFRVEGSFGPFSRSSDGFVFDSSFGLNFGFGGVEAYLFDTDVTQPSKAYSDFRQDFYKTTGVPLPWR